MSTEPDKKALFEAATQQLIHQVRNISTHFNFTVPYDIEDTVRKIRDAFQNPEIRKHVLNPKWEKINFEDERFAEGFCVITSYVFANAFRPATGPSPWQIMQFKDIPTFGTHVWLRFIPTGDVIDLTFDQFTTFEGTRMNIPYHKGTAVIPEFKNPGLDKFIDSIGPEFAAALRRNIASK